MAHEEDVVPLVVPPVVPLVVLQEVAKEQVVTQVSKEFVVPLFVESAPKEKALVPDSQNDVEGVPAKENEGQTSASMPFVSEKMKRPLAPLKHIDENAPASDDV